jgi:peroxiredoxin
MLALNYTPYFDLSEIITELTIPFKKYKALVPLAAGSLSPDFTLQREHGNWQRFFNGQEVRNTIQLRDILTKPLVIAFYSQQWKGHGLEFLKNLNALQHEISALGGNLLVISTEKENTDKIAWDNNLSLNFYFDQHHTIAEKFRLYSEKDPIWNRFSGIDNNVPLLATYVISPSRQIIYDHIELDFTETLSSKDLLTAVQQSSRRS